MVEGRLKGKLLKGERVEGKRVEGRRSEGWMELSNGGKGWNE